MSQGNDSPGAAAAGPRPEALAHDPAAKLDSIAKILAGSTVAVAGLLTAFGLNSDRIWVVLDQNRISPWLIVIGVLAVASIGLTLWALSIPPERARREAIVLFFASLCYVGGLLGVLVVARSAANVEGRPFIKVLTVSRIETGSQLEAEIGADRVDDGQTVTIEIKVGDQVRYRSIVPTDELDLVDSTVRLALGPDDVGRTAQVLAWRSDLAPPACDEVSADGSTCAAVTI